nr:MAG TPA: hypothetical protein [Bacteriophage sp.]
MITAAGVQIISVKTGAAGTHGAAGCPVSVRHGYREGVYISTNTRRVSTPSSRKIKKAFSNSKA